MLLTACAGGNNTTSDNTENEAESTTEAEATIEGGDFELAEQAAEDVQLDVPDANTLYEAALSSTDGEELYVTLCAKCHGLGGLGDGTSVGSLHIEGNFILTTLADRTDEELLETITYGKGVDMPAWGLLLSNEQIEAVLGYVRTLGEE